MVAHGSLKLWKGKPQIREDYDTFILRFIIYGEGNGTPLQYSCLENPMDGGAWWAAVHGVAKSRIRLSDFSFTFHFHALEREMATHSSVLAWRIPGTGQPSGLPSVGSHRVAHDWSHLAAAASVRASLMAQIVKNLPAMRKTSVRKILEKGMATHSSGASLWLSGKESAC